MVRMRSPFPFVGLLLWVAGSAQAGWTGGPDIGDAVRDALPNSAGAVGVATSTGGYELFGTQGVTQSLTGASVTAFVDENGCLVKVDDDGNLSATSGCNYSGFAGFVQGTAVVRLRRLPGGWAAACGRASVATGSSQLFFSNTGGASNWTASLTQDRCTRAMAMLQKGGQSYLLQAADPPAFGGTNNLFFFRTNQRVDGAQVGSGPPPVSVSLVDHPNGMEAWGVDAAGGLWRSLISTDQFAPFTQVTLPPEVAEVISVTLSRGSGGRFGMAVVLTTSGDRALYSAVPFEDPALFGTSWRPSTAPPALGTASPQEVHCAGAHTCAMTTDASGLGGAFTYENTQPPSAFMGPAASLGEGSSHPFTLAVDDPDGDAVVVTWEAAVGNPPATLQLSPDGLSGTFHAPVLGGLCGGGQDFTYTLTATDGRSGHTTVSSATFTVTRATPPLAPALTPTVLALEANGPAGRVDAAPVAGECAGLAHQWTPLTQEGVTLTPGPMGAFVEVTPPSHVCDPAGLNVTFDAQALNAHGASSPTAVQVTVAPWGPPEPPFGAGAVQTVVGGSSEVLSAAQAHLCHATTGSEPLVTTSWRLQSAPPANVTVTPPLSSSTDTLAQQVTVHSAEACDEGTFALTATNRAGAGAHEASEERTVTVKVEPDLQPVTEATLTLTLNAAGGAQGESQVDLDCLDHRDLQAEFLLTDGRGFEHRETHPVPGPWGLEVPVATCQPTTLSVQATLEGTGGAVVSNTVSWTSEGTDDPALGTLEASPLLARCEAGSVTAWATLSHVLSEDACLGQTTRWEHTEGPASLVDSAGDVATIRASGVHWDDVVGHTSRFAARATAGDRETQAGTLPVRAFPESPFVDAQVTVDPPLTSDASVVTVDVVLTNTSGCDVRSGSWVTQLERLRYVPGSALLDDQTAVAREEGGRLVVEGISLPAGGRSRVRILARPTLFGQAQASGQLEVHQAAVSRQVALGGEVASAGCGCSAGAAAQALWPLGALALLLTARRRSGGRTAARPRALRPGPEARSP